MTMKNLQEDHTALIAASSLPAISELPTVFDSLSKTETDLTFVTSGDNVLHRLMDKGLSTESVVQLLQMIEREEILKQYDFDSLKPDAKGQYRIWVSDPSAAKSKIRLYGKDLDTLREKVYRHIKNLPGSNKAITFEYAFKQAQKFEEENTPVENLVSKRNTIDRSDSEYRRFVKDTAFESKLMKSIRVSDIDSFIRATFKKHSLGVSGRNSLRALINMTFKRAYFMGWIDENPAARIIWKDYNQFLKQSPDVKDRAYTDKELEILCNTARKIQLQDPAYIPAYAYEFQLITGTRRGEIPPLLWEDVNFENGTIYIHREQLIDRQNHSKQVIAEYTKTKKPRYYAIADMEEEFLKKLLNVHDTYYPDSPYLFPADTENGCITCAVVGEFHHDLCKALNIPVSKDLKRGPHAFRRTRITEVINSTNGNTVLAAQMFGNSPETIRKNYYTKDNIAKQREALNCRKRFGKSVTTVTTTPPHSHHLITTDI